MFLILTIDCNVEWHEKDMEGHRRVSEPIVTNSKSEQGEGLTICDDWPVPQFRVNAMRSGMRVLTSDRVMNQRSKC